MKIALDLSWLPPRRAGAGRYAFELVNAFVALPDENTYHIYAPAGAFDDTPALTDRRFKIDSDMPSRRSARLAWEQLILPRRLLRDRPDVLHVPHSQAPLALTGVPIVVTFHDVTYELHPQRYPWLRRTYYRGAARMAARKARLLIAVSQRVKEDLGQTLSITPERVSVIPEAAGPQFKAAPAAEVERIRDTYDLRKPYVLSVGSLEPGKGRHTLIEAMEQVGDGYDLVIAGQQAWGQEATGSARYLGYVPDGDLPALYSGAEVFAFPSLYEGFGLPVLEAMSCGTPVVASEGSAISEVAGEAAILVAPGNAVALGAAVREVLADSERRLALREKGLARAACFSWTETASQTLAVYKAATG